MESASFTCCVPKAESLRVLIPLEREKRIVEKWCYNCRRYLPATTNFFYRNAHKIDGLCDECKECDLAARARRKRNKRNAKS